MKRLGFVALAACAGCVQEVPGEPVGAYDLVAALVENQCGQEALPVLAEVRFPVELREDDGRAVWRRKGAPLYYGVIGATGEYTFVSEIAVEVPLGGATSPEPPDWNDVFTEDPDSAAGASTCILVRREEIKVTPRIATDGGISDGSVGDPADGATVDAGDAGTSDAGTSDAGTSDAEAPDLEGTHRIEVLPIGTAACAPLLRIEGGPFEALPCTARYRITGSSRDEL